MRKRFIIQTSAPLFLPGEDYRVLKFIGGSSALDLAVLRMVFSGYMLLHSNLIKDVLFLDYEVGHFKPIGVFHLLSQPISVHYLLLIYKVWILLCCLFFFGFLTRWVAPFWFLSTVVVLGYGSNFGNISNSTQMLVLASFVLSLSYCSDRVSLDALMRRPVVRDSWDYFWPKRMLQVLVVMSLFVLGLQKLYFQGLDWIFSDKLYLTIFANPVQTEFSVWLLGQPLWLTQLFAFMTVFVVELLAPLALISPFHYIYPLIWSSFHLGIWLTFGGFKMFFSQIAVYMCFYSFDFIDHHFLSRLVIRWNAIFSSREPSRDD